MIEQVHEIGDADAEGVGHVHEGGAGVVVHGEKEVDLLGGHAGRVEVEGEWARGRGRSWVGKVSKVGACAGFGRAKVVDSDLLRGRLLRRTRIICASRVYHANQI